MYTPRDAVAYNELAVADMFGRQSKPKEPITVCHVCGYGPTCMCIELFGRKPKTSSGQQPPPALTLPPPPPYFSNHQPTQLYRR